MLTKQAQVKPRSKKARFHTEKREKAAEGH